MTKKSGPEHHHFTFSTRSPPPPAGSAQTQIVRQHPGLAAGQSASQTCPGSSGDPHFHAQNGSSSVRSPAVSRSKRLKLGPEPRSFTLKTAQAHSGAPHFMLVRGARSGAWAEFSLCRGTCLPKFGCINLYVLQHCTCGEKKIKVNIVHTCMCFCVHVCTRVHVHMYMCLIQCTRKVHPQNCLDRICVLI